LDHIELHLAQDVITDVGGLNHNAAVKSTAEGRAPGHGCTGLLPEEVSHRDEKGHSDSFLAIPNLAAFLQQQGSAGADLVVSKAFLRL
jgi:hypothetical protein